MSNEDNPETCVAVLGSDISCLQFDQRTLLTQKANLEIRIAELQALVDAALPHCYARGCDKLATHSDSHLYGDYACDEHAQSSMGRVHYAKYVIALARDLAAKEKEPTR